MPAGPNWEKYPDMNYYAVDSDGQEFYSVYTIREYIDWWIVPGDHCDTDGDMLTGDRIDMTDIDWTRTLRVKPGHGREEEE